MNFVTSAGADIFQARRISDVSRRLHRLYLIKRSSLPAGESFFFPCLPVALGISAVMKRALPPFLAGLPGPCHLLFFLCSPPPPKCVPLKNNFYDPSAQVPRSARLVFPCRKATAVVHPSYDRHPQTGTTHPLPAFSFSRIRHNETPPLHPPLSAIFLASASTHRERDPLLCQQDPQECTWVAASWPYFLFLIESLLSYFFFSNRFPPR